MFKLQKAGYNVNNLLADKQMDIKGFNEFMLNYKDGQVDGHKMVTTIIEKNNIVPNTESIMNLINSKLKSVDEFSANLQYIVAKGAQLNEQCVDAIIRNYRFNDKIIDFLVSKGFPPTKSSIRGLIAKGLDYYFKIENLLHIYETYYQPDVADLNCVLAHCNRHYLAKDINFPKEKLAPFCKRNSNTTSYKTTFVEYEDGNVVMDSACYFDIGLYLMGNGVTPNDESLNLACRDNNTFMFRIMINRYKLTPNNDTLVYCLRSYSIDKNMLVEILNYKVIPDVDSFKALMDHGQNDTDAVLEILLNAGLYITYDMLDYALSRRYIIKNLERFGIHYDEKLYWYCYRNNFDCYDFTEIDSQVIKMRKMANLANVDSYEVIRFMVDNDLKLDRYSLEYSIRRNNSLSVVLIGHFKCEPTIGSLISQNTLTTGQTNVFKRLLDGYKIDQTYMSQPINLDLRGYLDSLETDDSMDDEDNDD